MITFDTHVRIARPIDQVFSYVSDPGNLPHWNSAVQTVGRTSADGRGEVGLTYSMTRALPTGNVANDLEVVAHERPREFAIRTTSGPTPFVYRFRFTPQNGATIVGLEAAVQLGRAADLFASLARRAVRQGVGENLATLKTTLEEAVHQADRRVADLRASQRCPQLSGLTEPAYRSLPRAERATVLRAMIGCIFVRNVGGPRGPQAIPIDERRVRILWSDQAPSDLPAVYKVSALTPWGGFEDEPPAGMTSS